MIKTRNQRTLLLSSILLLGAAVPVWAQPYTFGPGGNKDATSELARVGNAIIIESFGPRLSRTGPIILEHGSLRNRWIMVQDSTMGVVFTQPSGVKMNSPDFDGDVDLRALTRVVAVEVRALLFNVWDEFSAYVSATRLLDANVGETWGMDPRWVDVEAPATEHRTSLMWVNRVMFADESYFEADLEPVVEAVRLLTGEDPPEDLGRPVAALPGG